MRRRNRNQKQVKIAVGVCFCVLLIMTTGYAAFSTNLNLSAKGNVVVTPESCFTVTDNGDGTGTIADYDKSCGGKVRIPNKINGLTITEIADGSYNSNTTIITSPFADKGITKIILPDNLVRIGGYAFVRNGIKEVKFPSTLESVGHHAFAWIGLEKVEMNEGLKKIDSGAFENCNLTSVTIPKTVTSLAQAFGANLIQGDEAFIYARNEDGSEDKTKLISFGDRNRKEVTVPEGVQYIGSSTFVSCTNIETINIPDSVSNIRDSVFYSMTNLKTVNIGSGITYIGNLAFGHTPKMQTINIKRKENAIPGAPWGATGVTVNWTGTV